MRYLRLAVMTRVIKRQVLERLAMDTVAGHCGNLGHVFQCRQIVLSTRGVGQQCRASRLSSRAYRINLTICWKAILHRPASVRAHACE